MASTMRTLGEDDRLLSLKQHVGFNTLPDQFVNRETERGFYFNLMVIGQTGIGKSTLIDSLFRHEFEEINHTHEDEGVTVDQFETELEEGGVYLNLKVVTSGGFGDQLDCTDSANPLIEYVDKEFESYLQEELKTKRKMNKVKDGRVHACIYMLEPTGRLVKSLDIHVMRQLHKKVNLIPVIGKSDVLSQQEVHEFKDLIRQELHDNDIEFYEPEADEEFDFQTLFPMAVIGSKSHITINGESVRVRQYPWGIVEVENEDHSDFVRLREMLLRTHMERLRRSTHGTHYMQYRMKRLTDMGLGGTSDSEGEGEAAENISLRESYEKKKQECQALMEKREKEMKTAFVKKAKAKEAELKEREQKLDATRKDFASRSEAERSSLKKQLQELLEEKKMWEEGVRREREQAYVADASGKKRDKTKKKKHKDEVL